MPKLIRHIDAICREKQRDVLYINFHPKDIEAALDYDYREDKVRDYVLSWLEVQSISWEPCGPYANVHVMDSYRGQVYIDVPFDDSNETYGKVCNFLEHVDGTMKFPTVRFYALKLEKAMKNAKHDEPGFWEKWIESF